MKNYFFKFASLLILLSLLMVSCSKENIQDVSSVVEPGYIYGNSKGPSYGAADLSALANKVAVMHNQSLLKAFEDNNLLKAQNKYDVAKSLNLVSQVKINTKLAFMENAPQYLNKLLSSSSYRYLNDAFSLCKNLNKTNYNKLTLSIDSIEALVSKNIKDSDEKLVVLTGLAVLDSSAYFWMPVNLGGSGVGFNYVAKVSGKKPFNLKVSGEWLLADAESATIGMFYVAVAGAVSAGTATPGALVGVAVTSAASSAVAALKSWW